MRTSRVSKETSKLIDALSSTRRQTRSSQTNPLSNNHHAAHNNPRRAAAAAAASNRSAAVTTKQEPTFSDDDGSSALSSAHTTDIEDLFTPVSLSSRKRKREVETSGTEASVFSPRGASPTPTRASTRAASSSRKPAVKTEVPKKPARARRLPARKSTGADGSVVIEPPSNWETMYATVKEMRRKNPTAPVDTMGCSQLYWRSSSPRDRRFHILIALMLSSQTKDTVTALAMQRLHTQLGPDTAGDTSNTGIKKEEGEDDDQKVKLPDAIKWDHTQHSSAPSTLTVENILAVSPPRLNALIRTVGFHNNKTKYIKAAAEILRDEYASDIPSTPEGLMRLPGVGPKMAYLCMSSAWGQDEGIGVDVHVHRITNLWGWNKTKTPEETRAALESWLPREKWFEINKLLVGLGQTVCLPVGKRCGECDLAGTGLCKAEIKGWTAKVKRGKTKKEELEVGGRVKEESKVKVKMEEDLLDT
ncbi:hypothetical protein AJ80_00618 [Polytolypa hystricis UAMH7299]|uniref:Endonuclease III homolog n=1 Tax=Polytolypa hystricis (strain UAMH7299) TaxID=1447883 RepID=A0A2B7Z1X5_POLH7|nr:hypothetical protein AJ80_00618 [Polytolypa hystricis UAMH7299]